jgi:hypothetical protein
MRTFRFHLSVLLWRLTTTSPSHRRAARFLTFVLAYAFVVLTQAALTFTVLWLVGPAWPALPDMLGHVLPVGLTDVPGLWHFVALAAVLRAALAYGTYHLLHALRVHWVWGLFNVLTPEMPLGEAADWARGMAWCVALWVWGVHLSIALVLAALASARAMG